MSPLFGLWLVSLGQSAIALLIMVGLIVARRIAARRQRVREQERRRLVPLLLGAEPSSEQFDQVERAPDLLADLSMELVQMVRGTDKENFIASSARLGVPERLRHRMDIGSPRTRLAAAEALGDFEDELSIDRLEEALDDRNADVRLSAALALASTAQPPPVRVLIEKLGIGTREHSLLVIGLFRDISNERPEEIRELVEDPAMDPSIKVAAVEALSASGDYSLVPLIADLVMKADHSAPELPRYLDALGRLGHPAGARAVEHALGSPDWRVRAAAAQAAGRSSLTDSGDRLTELLGDAQWWVRFRAGEALALLGEEGHRRLREAASGDNELAATAARLTVAERGLSK